MFVHLRTLRNGAENGFARKSACMSERKRRAASFPELESHYKVIERVGSGTYSIVWKAVRISEPSAEVAVKRFRPVYNTPKRILRELHLLKKCG